MHLRSIIRRRRLRIALCIALAAVIACALAARAGLFDRTPAAGLRARTAAEGLDHYAYELVFRPEQSTLAVTLTLDFTNRTADTLHDLVLRTWAGAYQSEDTSPAAIEELYDACYPSGFSAAGLTVEGAWWNGQTVAAEFNDSAQTALRVPIAALAPQESGTLLLRCLLTVPECAHRFGHAQGVWQFGNALPILSVYQNGAWRTDAYWPIGDPFVSSCANYDVTLLAPAGYQCAATGSGTRQTQADGRVRFTLHADAARDFAFALSDRWQSAAARANGVSVRAYAPSQEGAKRAAANAAKALRTYAALYGDYPYDQLTVCAVDFPFGGMEYPSLIFAALPYFQSGWADSLELLLAHETAHQWFYALVGSDGYNHPWQDEALCEYALLRYVRAAYGENAWQNLRTTRVDAPMRERVAALVTPGAPIDYFGDFAAYSTVVYGRGAAFLLAVEEMTGKLDAFLRAYCDAYAFQLASREEFAALLNRFTGEDLAPLMTDYLDTLMIN